MLNTSLPYEKGQFSVICRVMTEMVRFNAELQLFLIEDITKCLNTYVL